MAVSQLSEHLPCGGRGDFVALHPFPKGTYAAHTSNHRCADLTLLLKRSKDHLLTEHETLSWALEMRLELTVCGLSKGQSVSRRGNSAENHALQSHASPQNRRGPCHVTAQKRRQCHCTDLGECEALKLVL